MSQLNSPIAQILISFVLVGVQCVVCSVAWRALRFAAKGVVGRGTSATRAANSLSALPSVFSLFSQSGWALSAFLWFWPFVVLWHVAKGSTLEQVLNVWGPVSIFFSAVWCVWRAKTWRSARETTALPNRGGLGVHFVLGFALALLAFAVMHAHLQTFGPVAFTNNDAFYYIPTADVFARLGVSEVTRAAVSGASEAVALGFSNEGYFRNALPISAAAVMLLAKSVGMQLSGFYVIPSIVVFSVCFALGVFYQAVALLVDRSQRRWLPAVLTLLCVFSICLQRLYFEGFFPAAIGSAALLTCTVLGVSQLRRAQSLREVSGAQIGLFALLTSACWASVVCLSYPEAFPFILGVLGGFLTALVVITGWAFSRLVTAGVGSLAGCVVCVGLLYPVFHRFLLSLKIVLELPPDVGRVPKELVVWLAMTFGQVSFVNQAGPSGIVALGLCAAALVVYGYLLFLFVTEMRLRPRITVAALIFGAMATGPAVALLVRSVLGRQQYSFLRTVDLSLYILGGVLLGVAALLNARTTRASDESIANAFKAWLPARAAQSNRRSFSAIWLLRAVFFSSALFCVTPLSALYRKAFSQIRRSVLFETPTDRALSARISAHDPLAIVSTASMERSLFLAHYYLYQAELRSPHPVAYAQPALSYFHQFGADRISAWKTWVAAEQALLVGRSDCWHTRQTNRVLWRDDPEPYLLVPTEHAHRFTNESGPCLFDLTAPGEVLIVPWARAMPEMTAQIRFFCGPPAQAAGSLLRVVARLPGPAHHSVESTEPGRGRVSLTLFPNQVYSLQFNTSCTLQKADFPS